MYAGVKKRQKNGNIHDFAISDFLLQKKGQMLSDLNSEIRFEILSSFHSFITPIGKDLHILFFNLQ